MKPLFISAYFELYPPSLGFGEASPLRHSYSQLRS